MNNTKATCGTLESNDCLITITKHDTLVIDIESIVYDQFGDQIKQVIHEVLEDKNFTKGYITVKDKGALDYTIKSRLETAIRRFTND